MKSILAPKSFLIIFFAIISQAGYGQVIISLLLGDKLNSGKVEFGLDGGVNYNSQAGAGGKSISKFNLGFYFDIKLKNSNRWLIHTGVIVKSTMGGGSLPVYSLNDAGLDSMFAKGGSVDRTLDYFNVPIAMKYVFKNHFSLEAGPQLGLLYGGIDQFRRSVNGQPLTYDQKVRTEYKSLDAGLIAGLGYRLMKGNGMNLTVRYYWGLVDVKKAGPEKVMNRSLYLTVGIPIGAGKAKAREKNDGGSK